MSCISTRRAILLTVRTESEQPRTDESVKDKPAPDFEFRIIAGELKGKRITAPDPGVTRPPLTRLRKSIFDFLMPYLPEARYLDLFSGTGSYLFEAVSRGAVKALGVEMHPELAGAINRQARQFGIEHRLLCLQADVLEAVPHLAQTEPPFDIIMIAPPQYLGWIEKTLAVLRNSPVAGPTTLIICQHDSSETKKIAWGDYRIEQQRKYGNTTYSILQKPE
ncbi:hypothetical protein GF420_11345 [candidate division GN15 bacterium]|nr:hypothetical protein [candidate division GN15 bacterium]